MLKHKLRRYRSSDQVNKEEDSTISCAHVSHKHARKPVSLSTTLEEFPLTEHLKKNDRHRLHQPSYEDTAG